MSIRIGVAAALWWTVLSAFSQTVAFRWVETGTFSGHGTFQTAPFRIPGAEWRVSYEPKGAGEFGVSLCVPSTGRRVSVTNQKGKRARALSGSRSGRGPYETAYLSVQSSPGSWSLRVEQYLDRPTEWRLLRGKPYASFLEPFGVWRYESGDREFMLDIPDSAGRLTFGQLQAGRLSVTVIDEAGETVSSFVSLSKGSCSTWFYKPGVYTVRSSAIDTPWTLWVETIPGGLPSDGEKSE